MPLVAERLGLRLVQLTADLLNPALPVHLLADPVRKIKVLQRRYGIGIPHILTGALTRVNHLAHPDPKVRAYWVIWFRRLVDLSVALGAESMGSHFGILTVPDYHDSKVRALRIRQNLEGWWGISAYAARRGLRYLVWEPMSIPREYGETIERALELHRAVNRKAKLPFKVCLDVDHGDVASPNPRDTDPYAWIKAFGREAPIIHLKQTTADKRGHWPFTREFNRDGKITPPKILRALQEAGVEEVTLFLELSFRERQPFEGRVVKDLMASVRYWRPYVAV